MARASLLHHSSQYREGGELNKLKKSLYNVKKLYPRETSARLLRFNIRKQYGKRFLKVRENA